jgi:hypothetical protein
MNFKEINGEVFYYIEPTYIGINTKTPLLVRYYQGPTRMGLLNADLVSKQELNEERIVDKIINSRIAMYRNSNKGDSIHRLEMIGKQVPAESSLWWLYQMSIGKKITWPNSDYEYAHMREGKVYRVSKKTKEVTVMSTDKWLKVSSGIIGISFYSKPKLKAGDWIKAPLALYEHDLVCRVMSIYNGLTTVKVLLTGEEMKFINASPANRIDPEDIVKSFASPEMLRLLMADIDCQQGTNS